MYPCSTLIEPVQLRNFLKSDAVVNAGFNLPRDVEGAASAGRLCSDFWNPITWAFLGAVIRGGIQLSATSGLKEEEEGLLSKLV